MTQGLEQYPVTEQGLQDLKAELKELKGAKREEIAIKLERAIKQGDLKENADYHAAKEEQGFTEGRIRDLEDKLRRAVLIKDAGPSDIVRVGSTVTVLDEEYDEEVTYFIVGPHEADPANGRISNQSPYGKALVGAQKGQVVSVATPGGTVQIRVTEIA